MIRQIVPALMLLLAASLLGCSAAATAEPSSNMNQTQSATTLSATEPPTATQVQVDTTATAFQATATLAAATPTAEIIKPAAGAIVVDHNSINLFDHIPEQYLSAAQAMTMLFIDRSVGKNIDDGLNCLQAPNQDAAPNHCRRIDHIDPAYDVPISALGWQRPGGYNRPNWEFQFWPENDCSAWHEKVQCFLDNIAPVIDQYDVVSYQLSYLAVDDDSDIADTPGGYFSDNPAITDVFDQEQFEEQHPDTVFIYWTTSLARGIGTTVAESFNQQMRQYAIANNKPLFDVADILSHAPDGTPCYDNRDGIPYDNGNNQEDFPDDGQALPAICPHYTTETEGGHLGRVSAGKIRAAKGLWVLMAQIAGWTP